MSRADTDFLKNLTNDLLNKSIDNDKIADIITFTQASWGLNFSLLPAQKFFLKCLYRLPLDNTNKYIPIKDIFCQQTIDVKTQEQFLKWLIQQGRTNIISFQKYLQDVQKKRYNETILCCGRRSGKTNISSVIAAYQIYRVLKRYNPQAYYGFPQAEQIFFTCASVDSQGAVDLLNKIKSRFFGCPILKDKQVGDGAQYLTLQTQHDIDTYGYRGGVPTIKVNTGACASNGLRGKNSLMVILDEVAFFGDNENSKFSGTNVYNALTPSCASFKRKNAEVDEKGDGLVVLISSPKKQTGIFWETYQNSFKMTDDILMFRMYSALMNPQIDSNYLKLQYKKNPQVFQVEYGANFSTKTTHFISDSQVLQQCVDKTKTQNVEYGTSNNEYYMAIDLSYKNDATALSVVHKQGQVYYVDYVNAYFPGSSDVWNIPNSIYKNYNQLAQYPSFSIDIFGAIIQDLTKRFLIKKGIYDQWSGGYPLQNHLYNKGLQRIEMTSFGPNINSIIVDLFESLLRDKKIVFWNCQPMLKQILSLQVQTIRNNFRKVRAPQQQGYHDDIFDAISRAIYLCHINTQKKAPNVIIGGGINSSYISDSNEYLLTQMRRSKNHGVVQSRTINNGFRRFK